MSDLTPSVLLTNLTSLGRQLDNAQDEMAKAERSAAEKRHRADHAEAKAFLTAEGSVEKRKAEAKVETAGYLLDAEVAEAEVRITRSAITVLRERIGIGRTAVSAAKEETRAFGGAA